MSDPLPQALVLTAIVITFGVTAFLLAMAYRSWQLAGSEVVGDDEEDRRVARRLGHRRRRARPRRPRARRTGRRARRQPARPTTTVDGAAGPALRGIPSDDVDLPPTRGRRR